MKHKQYSIKHIGDILNIPEDKFDHFLIDLKTTYETALAVREVTEMIGDKSPVREFLPEVLWIDDDIHDGPIKIIMQPPEPAKDKEA